MGSKREAMRATLQVLLLALLLLLVEVEDSYVQAVTEQQDESRGNPCKGEHYSSQEPLHQTLT